MRKEFTIIPITLALSLFSFDIFPQIYEENTIAETNVLDSKSIDTVYNDSVNASEITIEEPVKETVVSGSMITETIISDTLTTAKEVADTTNTDEEKRDMRRRATIAGIVTVCVIASIGGFIALFRILLKGMAPR